MTPVPDHPMSRRAPLRAAGAAGLATAGAASLGTGSAQASAVPSDTNVHEAGEC